VAVQKWRLSSDEKLGFFPQFLNEAIAWISIPHTVNAVGVISGFVYPADLSLKKQLFFGEDLRGKFLYQLIFRRL
jgi:hypothetical protein